MKKSTDIKLWIISCLLGMALAIGFAAFIMVISKSDSLTLFYVISIFFSWILTIKFYPLVKKMARDRKKVVIKNEGENKIC